MKLQLRSLARQSRRQQARGIEIEEKVWRLYITGKRQTAIAAQLQLSESRVSRYVAHRLHHIEQNAPRNPDELAVMRELIAARLESTIEETYRHTKSVDHASGKLSLVTKPATAPMLAIRLKAMDQLAKLYGINLPPQLHSEKSQLYTTPLEIAAKVNQRILALHGHSMRGLRLSTPAN
jgi:predicted transcriptional regulator